MPLFGTQLSPSRLACSTTEVARIATLPDPDRRNLAITRSYHHLTLAVGERLGRRDLPWTGFAVWASRTAGTFIRGHWLPKELRALVNAGGGLLAHRFAALEAQVRAHVAEGNRLVYAEIAPLFVDLLAVLDAPVNERAALRGAVQDRLRPGPVERGGQRRLAAALRHYLDASECDDDAQRAELMLLANLQIGYHEQWRLQDDIQAALDAAWAVLPRIHHGWLQPLQLGVARALRRLLTRRMMHTRLPDTELRLSRDVPPLPDGRMFPEPLGSIDMEPLRQLLATIDRTPNTTKGSGARDWADFGDRMNYVVDMFRSRQREPLMWSAPLTAAQLMGLRDAELM